MRRIRGVGFAILGRGLSDPDRAHLGFEHEQCLVDQRWLEPRLERMLSTR